jgi:hypothetical protein
VNNKWKTSRDAKAREKGERKKKLTTTRSIHQTSQISTIPTMALTLLNQRLHIGHTLLDTRLIQRVELQRLDLSADFLFESGLARVLVRILRRVLSSR